MKKRILLTIAAVAAVAVGVVGMSAFEAHVINVTAHIENALSVLTEPIAFGTVFPQEYFDDKNFTISLSDSFEAQNRLGDVEYKIEQKPKCINDELIYVPCQVGVDPNNPSQCLCPPKTETLPDLCRFLSKTPIEPDGDIGHPSYYTDNGVPGPSSDDSCSASTVLASGVLNQNTNDLSDTWTVDLKVPPVAGNVGQDWPVSCANFTVPTDGATYGCDLWVEVTGLSPYCGNYIKQAPEECDDGPSGSNTCTTDCHIILS